MTRRLRIDVEWLARELGTPAERAGFGELRIAVDGTVLTELTDAIAKTTRQRARLSALHLGRWLATNWWRLRWEPEARDPDWQMSHQLTGAGGGFLWPPVTIVSDGEFVALRAQRQRRSGHQMVEYIAECDVVVPAVELERAIDRFMDALDARLRAMQAPDDALAELWAQVKQERKDSQTSLLRRGEAMLGLDAEGTSRETLQRILRAGAWMGSGALDEVLAASRMSNVRTRLHELRSSFDDASGAFDASNLNRIVPDAGQPNHDSLPWQRGLAYARTARERLALGTRPLGTELLSDLLGVSVLEVQCTGGRIAAAFRHLEDPARIHTALRSPPQPASRRRFEIARLIADLIAGPAADSVLPITTASTARQKLQRAFAQELLCPTEALKKELTLPAPGEDEISEIAAHYEVSEWTVISALVNRGLVPRNYLSLMSA